MKSYNTMDDVIRHAKEVHNESPELGNEDFLIKVFVSAWLWEQFKGLQKDPKKDPDLWVLDFITKVTK